MTWTPASAGVTGVGGQVRLATFTPGHTGAGRYPVASMAMAGS